MKYETNTYKLDTNVTIKTPNIEVSYDVTEDGWIIHIDERFITKSETNISPMIFKDISEATDYLISKDLVVTKAYEEYSKRVRKSIKSTKEKEKKDDKASARVGTHPASRG